MTIIYVCGYPRSGSAWMRQSLEYCFEQVVTGGHGSPVQQESYLQQLLISGEFKIKYHHKYYLCLCSQYSNQKTYLIKNPSDIISKKETRRYLSKSQKTFFIKLHSPPFQEYFQNEYIIFLVRHPIAVFSSYQRFQKKFRGVNPSFTDIITGKIHCVSGSYLRYMDSFINTLSIVPHLIVRYEDKMRHPLIVLDKIREITGLNYFRLQQPQLFEYKIYSDKFKDISIGKMTSWMGNIEDKEIRTIFNLCHKYFNVFGYELPSKNDLKDFQSGNDISLASNFPLTDFPIT